MPTPLHVSSANDDSGNFPVLSLRYGSMAWLSTALVPAQRARKAHPSALHQPGYHAGGGTPYGWGFVCTPQFRTPQLPRCVVVWRPLLLLDRLLLS